MKRVLTTLLGLGPFFLLLFACGAPNSRVEEPETRRAEATASRAAEPESERPVASSASATTEPVGEPTSSAGAPESSGSASPSSSSSAPAAPLAGTSKCPAGMTFVAGGEFQRAGTDRPSKIPDLCVDTLETTARLYDECVKAGKCTTSGLNCAAQSTYGKPEKAEYPLVCAEFVQAEAYCAFRGKRLPTTDEWEWVARGGAEARVYPWGDAEPDAQLCWAGKHKQTESCPVGTHPGDVTASGILDMGGNVLEFTTTAGDATSAVRIARGGSWNVGAPELFRTARLGGFGPDYRCGFLGIRCVTANDAKP